MATYSRSGYGYRFADKVAEQDRTVAVDKDQEGGAPKPISAAKAWRMVARGGIDVAAAMRLIEGSQEGDQVQERKAAEKKYSPE